MKETTKYKTIISILNSSCEGFNEYLEMIKRIGLFVDTEGASESNGMMDEGYVGLFVELQEKLYKKALEKKLNESC